VQLARTGLPFAIPAPIRLGGFVRTSLLPDLQSI